MSKLLPSLPEFDNFDKDPDTQKASGDAIDVDDEEEFIWESCQLCIETACSFVETIAGGQSKSGTNL